MINKDFSKGMWLLIKKYPENIYICPDCGRIIWSKDKDSLAFKTCKTEFAVYELSNFIPYMRCYKCGFSIQENIFLNYKDVIDDFLEKYFSEKNKTQNYEDFLEKVDEFVECANKKYLYFNFDEEEW